jgi:pseudouridine kinase
MYLEEPSFSDKRVLVIGASTLDIVGRLSVMPETGTSTPAKIRPTFGGVARNVAENLARLGQKVSLITVVGETNFGDQLLQETASAGVDVSASIRTEEFRTSTYLAVVTPSGQLQFGLDDMRALSTLKPEHIKERANLFKDASMVFVDMNLSPATLRSIFSQARMAKIPVCADATSKKLAPRLIPFLSRLKLVTANSDETSILCEGNCQVTNRQTAIQAARYLISKGVEYALIPMAEFGVCYAASEISGHIPAIRTSILDPTGAGDALTATLIFALINEIPLDDAVQLGIAAASLTLRYPGAVFPKLSLEKLYDHLLF